MSTTNPRKHLFAILSACAVGLGATAIAAAQPAQPAQPETPKPPQPPQQQPEPQQPPAGQPQQQPQADAEPQCPPFLENVKVKTETVEGGVAILFNAPKGADVKTLQTELKEAANQLEQQSQPPAGQGEQPPEGQQFAPAEQMPPLDVQFESIPSGARIEVTAERPEDVEAVRKQAKEFEQAWAESPCVEPQAGGQPQQTK